MELITFVGEGEGKMTLLQSSPKVDAVKEAYVVRMFALYLL